MRSPRYVLGAFLMVVLTMAAGPTFAGDSQPPREQPRKPRPASPPRFGAQGFGGGAVGFPVASDSLTAAALQKRPIEAGGGAQVTNIWRSLFVQAAFSQWSDTGERAFVDSRGTRFGLGIPLTVKATYIDLSVGWRPERLRGPISAVRVVPFVGAGVGLLRYKEGSPFAEPGEDLNERFTTYHALAGAEYWIWKWVAVAGDVKYRWIRDVIGTGGVSNVLGEDRLDGTAVTFRVLIGPGGPLGRATRRAPRRVAPPTATPKPAQQPRAKPELSRGFTAITNTSTPVYIAADQRRQPLRTLSPGVTVSVRRDMGEWLLIEFSDPQWGSRVGYVLRKNVDYSPEGK